LKICKILIFFITRIFLTILWKNSLVIQNVCDFCHFHTFYIFWDGLIENKFRYNYSFDSCFHQKISSWSSNFFFNLNLNSISPTPVKINTCLETAVLKSKLNDNSSSNHLTLPYIRSQHLRTIQHTFYQLLIVYCTFLQL